MVEESTSTTTVLENLLTDEEKSQLRDRMGRFDEQLKHITRQKPTRFNILKEYSPEITMMVKSLDANVVEISDDIENKIEEFINQLKIAKEANIPTEGNPHHTAVQLAKESIKLFYRKSQFTDLAFMALLNERNEFKRIIKISKDMELEIERTKAEGENQKNVLTWATEELKRKDEMINNLLDKLTGMQQTLEDLPDKLEEKQILKSPEPEISMPPEPKKTKKGRGRPKKDDDFGLESVM